MRILTIVNSCISYLRNLVCTASIGITLDLTAVVSKARNAEYNPARFPAVIMRLRDPKVTCLLFASGKLVLTGNKTEGDARQALKKVVKILQVHDIDISPRPINIEYLFFVM